MMYLLFGLCSSKWYGAYRLDGSRSSYKFLNGLTECYYDGKKLIRRSNKPILRENDTSPSNYLLSIFYLFLMLTILYIFVFRVQSSMNSFRHLTTIEIEKQSMNNQRGLLTCFKVRGPDFNELQI